MYACGEIALVHLNGCFEPDVARRPAHLHFEGAGIDHPVLFLRAPVGEGGPIQGKLHRLCLPGLQFDALKALQFMGTGRSIFEWPSWM